MATKKSFPRIESRDIVPAYAFCEYIGVDWDKVHDLICASPVSFGNNPDTLLDKDCMAEFLKQAGVKNPKLETGLWYSLGC